MLTKMNKKFKSWFKAKVKTWKDCPDRSKIRKSVLPQHKNIDLEREKENGGRECERRGG